MSTSLPPERSLFPMIPSPTPSESDTSLTFEHTFEREVTGQERVPSYQLSPSREEYPHVERHRRESDVSNVSKFIRLLALSQTFTYNTLEVSLLYGFISTVF